MTKRLIDAEALKAKWYEINDIDETDMGARFVGYSEIARLIDQAPTLSADAEPAKPQTIAQIVEEVSEEICDHYCKWPEQYGDDESGLLNEKCDGCPLNRL